MLTYNNIIESSYFTLILCYFFSFFRIKRRLNMRFYALTSCFMLSSISFWTWKLLFWESLCHIPFLSHSNLYAKLVVSQCHNVTFCFKGSKSWKRVIKGVFGCAMPSLSDLLILLLVNDLGYFFMFFFCLPLQRDLKITTRTWPPK